MTLSLILSILIWVLTGGLTAYLAVQRGRDPFVWFTLGIFFGLLSLIALFLLPPVVAETQQGQPKKTVVNALEPTPSSDIQASVPTHSYLVQDWFCIDKLRQQLGPMRYDELKHLWQDKKIDDGSFVWSEGMGEWKKIADLSELRHSFAES